MGVGSGMFTVVGGLQVRMGGSEGQAEDEAQLGIGLTPRLFTVSPDHEVDYSLW